MQIKQKCIQCKREYNFDRIIYQCKCSGLLEIVHDLKFLKKLVSKELFNKRLSNNKFPLNSGVWRFKELVLPIEDRFIISRREGNTNIYESKKLEKFTFSKNLLIKNEGENPTGSFKDRGITVGLTLAKYLGIKKVACASTGNTASSLASYAALANVKCTVFIPKNKVAYDKLSQALAYGAITYEIEGDFDNAMKLVKEYCIKNNIYLLNSLNSFRLEGQKSIVFELIQQLKWKVPDWIVVPGGNLGNVSSFSKALYELNELNLIDKIPRIAVIQAENANPFYRGYKTDFSQKFVVKANTIASAINIGNPVNYDKAVRGLKFCKGIVEQVSDQEIMDAKAQIDSSGIGCEPASAASIAGLKKLIKNKIIDKHEKVVCILTGNILKDSDSTMNYHLSKLNGIESRFANKLKEWDKTNRHKLNDYNNKKIKVKVFAPASIANLGPGFDILGCAIENLGDIVEAEKIEEKKVEIVKIKGDNHKLPFEPLKNTAGIAAIEVLKLLKVNQGVKIKLYKGMPLGSGLGSSGASAVASAFAINLLFGNKLPKLDLIKPCLIAEQAVSGYHADNVASSLLGGFVLIRSYEPLEIIPLGYVDKLFFVIANPDYELSTKLAREKVPKMVKLQDAIFNNGNSSAIVAGILKNDIKLIGRSINDKIVEPARSLLIPGFYDVKKSALDAGAYGCSISGAGPSIFAVIDDKEKAENIGNVMKKAFSKNGLNSQIYISKVSSEGAKDLN